MNSTARFKKLFEPTRIGSMELKNRIAMAPMGTRFATVEGDVPERQVAHYGARGRGGTGLVIVESAYVHKYPGRIQVSDDKYIPGLKRIADAVHEGGGKVALQMQTRRGRSDLIDPVCPSAVPHPKTGVMPRVLSTDEIAEIVEAYGKAAARAKKAGFDAIGIHGASGYLLCEWMSPLANKRTDKYGGSLENRARLATEVIASARASVGPDFPIIFRMCADEHVEGGFRLEEAIPYAQILEKAGIDIIDVTSGSGVHTYEWIWLPNNLPDGANLHYAAAIKKAVNIPIMVAGRLKDPYLAEKALEEGKADFISLGRALLADPSWANKAEDGKPEEIYPCISCLHCHNKDLRDKLGLTCAVNAVVGGEDKYEVIKPAEVKKKVLIVGGGPGGMQAARVAALKGHEVILCERHRQLGGLMLLGAIHNEEIPLFIKWMVDHIKNLPIDVRLNTEVTPALVEELKPDVVILANGGTFVKPEVPGIDRNNVFSAQDLLNLMNGIPVKKGLLMSSLLPFAKRAVTTSMVRRALSLNFPVKKKVAVIGGQFPGCALALFLAEKKKKVTVIEESDQFGKDVEPHIMKYLQDEIKAGNVEILTSTKVAEINNKGVVVNDADRNKTLREAGTVIVALDLAPSDGNLAKELKGKVKEIYTVGDANEFLRIWKANTEGYMTAYNL
ncbi:FAD-dependent oxidoreductase [Chloroflexota bacterium]